MEDVKHLSDPLKYFFRKLEKKNEALEEQKRQQLALEEEVRVNEIEQFMRALKTQNIFITTVGMSGKKESTILAKAVYSLNKVIKIYYSSSFDEDQGGYISIHPCYEDRKIVIERFHGYRPSPERLYESTHQNHIIKFIANWMLKHIDWQKTKLDTLDLYKQYRRAKEHEEELAKVAEQEAHEAAAIAKALEKHEFKRKTVLNG